MLRIVLMVLVGLLAVQAEARQIVDMAGRSVEVPERIERVLGSVAPVTWLVYALDPALLAAVNSAPSKADRAYLSPVLNTLPAIGAFGGTRGLSREKLLALQPDLVVFWGWRQGAVNRRRARQLADWGIASVFVELDRVEQYPAALRFLGGLLHREARAERLAAYGERVLAEVEQATAHIPAAERVRVYYAEGGDGLATEPHGSFHAELISLAGGVNVHRGTLDHYAGREKVSLEQVLRYDPQVMLVREKQFFETVATDRRWQNVRAVRDGRVWLIPDRPLNWFDRPPSFMRFLGLQWLAQRLYPQYYAVDMAREIDTFFQCFLQVDSGRGVLAE